MSLAWPERPPPARAAPAGARPTLEYGLRLGLAGAIAAAIAGAAGTHPSRWYVTPVFTTVLVFLLLLYSSPDDARWRFGERVGETLLGVGLAYVFGLALPAALSRRRAEA